MGMAEVIGAGERSCGGEVPKILIKDNLQHFVCFD